MRIGLGVFLLVVGAVLAFAVRDSWSAFDVTVVGYILMGGGVLVLLLSLLTDMPRTRRARSTQVSTDSLGRQAVVERDDRISGV